MEDDRDNLTAPTDPPPTRNRGGRPKGRKDSKPRPRRPRKATVPACATAAEVVALADAEPGELPDWFLDIPAPAQAAIWWRAMGFAAAEVAKRIGKSPDTVRQLWHRYDPQRVFRCHKLLQQKLALAQWAKAEDAFLARALDNIDDISPAQCVVSAGIARDKLRDAARLQVEATTAERASTLSRQLEARFRDSPPITPSLPAHDSTTA